MTRQWFMDEEFDLPLPEWLSDDCARFYGTGDIGINFAQGLASFLNAKGYKVVPSSMPDEPRSRRRSLWLRSRR